MRSADMTKRKTPSGRLLGVVLGVLVLLAAACGGGDGGGTAGTPGDGNGNGGQASGDPIKLGAIVPSTGPVAEWGQGNEAVLKMLEDEVNAEGGIEGRPLEIVIYDSGARPEEAANLVRRLADDEGVLAIIGPFTSSEAEVAFPVANQMEIVSTAQASSKPGLAEENRPWAFRNTVDEGTYLNEVTPALVEEEGVQSIAIAYDSADAVGSAIGSAIMPAVFEESGLEIVNADDAVTFKTDDTDVQAQVTRLTDISPDAIGIGAFYNGAVKILREMGRQGLEAPVAGGSPLVSSSILEANPNVPIYAAGTYFVGLEEAGDWTERAQAAYEESGLDGDPLMFDLQTYEIGLMYIEAIRENGLAAEGTDIQEARTAIRDFMQNLENFEGVTGSISMQESGDAVRDFYVIRGIDGSWETVKRIDKSE